MYAYISFLYKENAIKWDYITDNCIIQLERNIKKVMQSHISMITEFGIAEQEDNKLETGLH